MRTTAQAVADLADETLARSQRNVAYEFAGIKLDAPPWLSALGKIGLDVGTVALRAKLGALGIGADMFGLVEEELNREGLSMGAIANPHKLPTLDNFFGKSA